MPSSSCLQQTSGLLLHVPEGTPFGSQQLLATLHAVALELVLQVSPGLLHELPFPHRPNGSVDFCFWHCRPPAMRLPQQSEFVWQSSPSGLQPDGSSQILTPPVAPLNPHDREQQLVSQA
jgi:hypothetical protein